jgi:hypothetical protein
MEGEEERLLGDFNTTVHLQLYRENEKLRQENKRLRKESSEIDQDRGFYDSES